MKRKALLTFAVLGMALIGMSQTTDEFKPSGKVFGSAFTNFYTTVTDGKSASGFQLNRLELGYTYNFSSKLSAKLCIDVGNPETSGALDFTAFSRNAYLEFKDKGWTIDFGIITGTAYNLQENFWSLRYVEKSYQDLYKYSASRDLGAKVAYKFNDIISADVFIANGEGYKKMQRDSALRVGFGATLTPVEKLILRGYYDFLGNDNNSEVQNIMALFAGYQVKTFSIGFEYNQMTNTKMVADADQDGISTYVNWQANSKLKVFGRYDHRMSKDDWNLANDGDLLMAGLEYAPVKGVKLAPTFSGWSPKDDAQSFNSTFLLNCEIKF